MLKSAQSANGRITEPEDDDLDSIIEEYGLEEYEYLSQNEWNTLVNPWNTVLTIYYSLQNSILSILHLR